MALSTDDVVISSGSISKTIEPGNNVVRINSVELKQFDFMKKENGYFLILNVETKPVEGTFEGFFIDPEHQEKGRYEGQIGQVKTNQFYYKDGTTKTGKPVSRDRDILTQIKLICGACGCDEWFTKANNKYDTIEDFVKAFNKDKAFKNKWINICIAGKEYEKKTGYTAYDLFLPKYEKGKSLIESADAKPSNILIYDKAKHLKVAEKNIAQEPIKEVEDPFASSSNPTDNDDPFKF